jgi:zinc transport system substrate-binding protein
VKGRHFIWLLTVLMTCGQGGAARAGGRKLSVLTTFLPVYCFALNVAGDLAVVENLLPPGVEPHDFQFTPREMRKLAAADVVVMNGLHLESWLTRVINQSDRAKVIVEAAAGLQSELISESHLETDDLSGRRSDGLANSHIWLDPQLAEHAVTNILRAFQTADAANAAAYARNARAYIARLQDLDTDLRAGLTPLRGQPMVTFHDAFPYFARRYGLRIAGVIEKVPDVQPSPRYLAALGRIIQTQRVRVIFTERQSSPRLAAQIGRDYHTAVAQLDTLETGKFAPESYELGMRNNLRVLEEYLK